MARLFLLFTIVPLVELFLLLQIGRVVGFWPTVAVVLLTAAAGAHLAHREGLKAFLRWREALARGRLPEEGILGSLLVLVGGVLLITPGVLTDVAALLLLFPRTRRIASRLIRRSIERRIRTGTLRVVSYRGSGRRRGGRTGAPDAGGAAERRPVGGAGGRASDQVIETRPVEPTDRGES